MSDFERFMKLPAFYTYWRKFKSAEQEQAFIRSPKGLFEILVATQYLFGQGVHQKYTLDPAQKKILAEKIVDPVYDLFRQIEKNRTLTPSDFQKIESFIFNLEIEKQNPPLKVFFKGVQAALESLKSKIKSKPAESFEKKSQRTLNDAQYVAQHRGKLVAGLNQSALAAMGNSGGLCQGFAARFLERFKDWEHIDAAKKQKRLSHLTKPKNINNALSMSLEVALKYSMQPEEKYIPEAILSRTNNQTDFLDNLFKKAHVKNGKAEKFLIHIGNDTRAHALAIVREGDRVHFHDSERLYCTFEGQDREAKFKAFLKNYLNQHYKSFNTDYKIFDYEILAEKVLTLPKETLDEWRANLRAGRASKAQWHKFKAYMQEVPKSSYKVFYSEAKKSIEVQLFRGKKEDVDFDVMDRVVRGLKIAGCSWVILETTKLEDLPSMLKATEKHFKFDAVRLGPAAEQLLESFRGRSNIDPVVKRYLKARERAKNNFQPKKRSKQTTAAVKKSTQSIKTKPQNFKKT